MKNDLVRNDLRPSVRKWQSLIAVASCLSLLTLGAVTTLPALAAPPQMGIGIGGVDDWNNELLFADAMKEARTWDDPTNGSSLPTSSLDANGWPNRDAQIYVWAGSQSNMAGTYALSFSGQATVTLQLNGGNITGQIYNSTTNTTTATLNLLNGDCQLKFTNTRQTAGSALNTGIKNIVLMRPVSPGATTTYAPGTLFSNPVKNLIAKFSTIRFMDYLATNGNPSVSWTDRTRPAFYSQQRHPGNLYGNHVMGGALEYAVLLGNQTGKDIWINIPIKANDDYITKVAQLIAYGSDGTNPYTSAQANPVYPPLNASLKVYVEYANEVWNTAGPFDGNLNHTLAQQEVAAGGSPLNFDGDNNDWYWAWRRTAKRSKEMSDIFRGVWGNANMMTRVRPVLESQLGYQGGPLMQEMHMMQDYYNSSRFVATPRPPSYYFYGGGGSAYYNPDNAGSWNLTTVWNDATFNPSTWLTGGVQADVNYILGPLGHRIAYEGGPSLDRTGASADSLKEQVWADSRMTTEVIEHQTAWDQSGGDLLMYFTSLGDYQWGFTHDINNLNTPKLNAINSLNATTKPVGTYGLPVPASLTASAYVAPETFAGSNPGNLSANGNWTWVNYVVKVSTASTFNVGLRAGSVGTSNTAEVYVDGASLGTITIPNTGSNSTVQATTALAAGTLVAGTHGITVKARSGSFCFDQVIVTAGGTAQVSAPAFSPGGGTYSSAQSVTISSATPGSTIRYTTNGTNPTSTTGTVYSGAISIASTLTLKAIAYQSGSTDSTVTSALYTIGGTTYTSRLFPRSGNASRLIGGKIQGSANNTNWTDLATVTTATEGQWQTLNTGTTNYRYWRFLSPDNGWGNVAEVEFYNNGARITGTGIGTPGSWNNAGDVFSKALDGNTASAFDGPTANGVWVGIDTGGAPTNTYTAKLYPRAGWASRLVGGKIQGSSNGSTWTDLATIGSATDGQWLTVNTGTTNYRYWRYLAPNATWGNVAEVEFYDNGVKITGTGIGTPGSWNNQGNTFSKALDGNTTTYFDAPDPGNGDWVGIDRGF